MSSYSEKRFSIMKCHFLSMVILLSLTSNVCDINIALSFFFLSVSVFMVLFFPIFYFHLVCWKMCFLCPMFSLFPYSSFLVSLLFLIFHFILVCYIFFVILLVVTLQIIIYIVNLFQTNQDLK